jgi:uncharacterized protein YlbG (UPF0298 family)
MIARFLRHRQVEQLYGSIVYVSQEARFMQHNF